MLKSKTITYSDYSTDWYIKWSKLLKQDDGFVLNPEIPTNKRKIHNKAWQNAAIMQAAHERDLLRAGNSALGFGVGTERLPSAFASLGVRVTATDQNFISGKKAGWDNGQLSRKAADLNKFKICSPSVFKKNVQYRNCDMNSIDKRYVSKFDLVWSNCALGHLGSIENGLKFIERSLACLKPGGVAIHTTEVNILNNHETLSEGGTVIFTLENLVSIFYQLRKQGYICEILDMNLGQSSKDLDIKFHPYDTDNLLKIHVAGHFLSQIILIIKKPKKKHIQPYRLIKKFELFKNRRKLSDFLNNNSALSAYLSHQDSVSLNGLKPLKRKFVVQAEPSEVIKVRIEFKNAGNQTFYDMYHRFYSNYPIVIATSQPVNRDSLLANKSWHSKNRPTSTFHPLDNNSKWGALSPGKNFYINIELKAPSKSGTYIEHFSPALEGLGIFEDAEFSIALKVT